MLVAAPLLFAGLGRAPFDDPGEGMHAEIAWELAMSRDPLALTLNGVRYVDKPPLLYVLIAAVSTVSGPSEAAARAVSACAALAAVGATAWLGAHLLGPRGGLVAGVALLTGIGFFAYGRYVRPETLFVAALAGGFALCLVGIRDGRRGLCAAGLALFGCAALAKDPLGALLPPLAIGVALALAGRARPFSAWLPGTGVAACLIIGFGWWVGAELRTPGFGWYTTIDNHVLNVARARHFADEDVPLTAVEFLAVAIGSTLPWIIAAGVAVWSLARRRAWRSADEVGWVALTIWVLGVFGVTALSPFRLPHYGLPASFAVALLATMPGVTRSLGVVTSNRAVRDLAWSVARQAGPDDVLAHEGPIENSGALEWYSGRRPVIVDGLRSVLGFGAERPESRDLFWDAARLRQAWTGGRRVWVVSVRSPGRSVVADLPGARLLGVSGGRALWVNEIR